MGQMKTLCLTKEKDQVDEHESEEIVDETVNAPTPLARRRDQWQGCRDMELICACSRTCTSNRQGDSYPAAESHENVLCEADLILSIAPRQLSTSRNDTFLYAV